MSNIIAVIWDFDKTLVDGYMQDPIFKKYGVDSKKFWEEVNALPDKYWEEQQVKVNRDTIYLNHFINKTKEGVFKGLNNKVLFELGKELKFYKGIPEIFEKTKDLIEKDTSIKDYNIKVEHYIVSTGMKRMIEGSIIKEYVEDIWGCELIQSKDENGNFEIIMEYPENEWVYGYLLSFGEHLKVKEPERIKKILFEKIVKMKKNYI